MHKATLTLLASSGILGAMVLIGNPAVAAEIVALPANSVLSAPTVQSVDAIAANPMLTLSAQQSNPIADKLGCQCATCQAAGQLQGQLPF